MKFLKIHANILKNWKETWGSLIVLLIPLLYTIEYTKDIIIKFTYHWVVGLLLFLAGWIQTNYHFESKQKLRSDISSLENANGMLKSNLESIPDNMTKTFFKHFGLGNKDRVTTYRVDENEFFIQVGRYSDNPIFKKGGRGKYPINEGFIGECWVNEEVKVTNLPDFDKNPDRYYDEIAKKCTIEKAVVNKIKMKSRSFYCKRLSFNGEEPIAVIVIESCSRTFSVDMDEFAGFLDGPFGKSLVDTIKNNLPIGKDER
ncbi:hypothetical protein [Lysinibacillus sp. SGAir0095]|uniref:hypothetical protein n=1 Tax=Lysinibacillus sp. SGAir0095 TaxID=2070463 RepID=UPI0010CD41AC|nr:hypothetical protein [Lysinibacillus sp. SGAir0095]QCR33138.1 hypothetical protein C1N55_13530 [Lysinibacillus sp. SGAir0095]